LRHAEAEIAPHAQKWHQCAELIPIDVVRQLAEMGVFGLMVREGDGGLGLGKTAMCVVSEALSGG
jgi:(2S)-methylsuccinyl-CoA dehydrogenase